MTGKSFNICFIQNVEKHPELYDYTFKDYGNENVTNKSWYKVAMEVKILTVNECKAKWNSLLSMYISNMKTLSSSSASSGKKNKNPYHYLTEAMEFMLPLIKTSGAPIEHLSDDIQQPTLEVTQCCPNSTLNLLDMIEKEEDFQPVRSMAINSLSSFSPAQLLTNSMRSQKTDLFHEKVPNYFSTLNTTPKTGKSQKRTFTDVDGSLAGLVLNMKNKKISMASDQCTEERKLFLLSLLPKVGLMTNSQMSLFERGVKQIIDDIINPSSYLQLPLPSTYSPIGSLVSSSHSLPSMNQYLSMNQYSYLRQYPLSLPTYYHMPYGQQQNNYTQESRTFSPQDIFSQSFGTYSPQTMNYFSSNFENFHTAFNSPRSVDLMQVKDPT